MEAGYLAQLLSALLPLETAMAQSVVSGKPRLASLSSPVPAFSAASCTTPSQERQQIRSGKRPGREFRKNECGFDRILKNIILLI